jgi:predicted DNA binding CopG/RHH family protein
MKRKIEYSDAPEEIAEALAEAVEVNDFLPPPEKLIAKQPKVKITISLNSRSIDFFKREAKKQQVKYQTMINEVLDRYTQQYEHRQ